MRAPTLNFSPAVEVFDASIRVGDSSDACGAEDRSSLLAELDRRGVTKALVYHAHAETISPRTGHAMLEAFIAGEPRLTPQACVLPSDDCLSLLDGLERERKLQCARLAFHEGEPLLFTPDFYARLLGWLAEREVALWVPAGAVDWRDLVAVGRTFPALPLVLVGAHYMDYLWVKPVMRALPNLVLELSRYEAFDQVDELAAEFGAGRLIYGSGYPRYAMGPVLHYLHLCALTDEQLAQVCGGNLQRLLRREGFGG